MNKYGLIYLGITGGALIVSAICVIRYNKKLASFYKKNADDMYEIGKAMGKIQTYYDVTNLMHKGNKFTEKKEP